eukprot:Hpha_TRINITY_DN15997_c2_g2::TRINITY_DN15997_c2_g2_i1::g.70242::m.70242
MSSQRPSAAREDPKSPPPKIETPKRKRGGSTPAQSPPGRVANGGTIPPPSTPPAKKPRWGLCSGRSARIRHGEEGEESAEPGKKKKSRGTNGEVLPGAKKARGTNGEPRSPAARAPRPKAVKRGRDPSESADRTLARTLQQIIKRKRVEQKKKERKAKAKKEGGKKKEAGESKKAIEVVLKAHENRWKVDAEKGQKLLTRLQRFKPPSEVLAETDSSGKWVAILTWMKENKKGGYRPPKLKKASGDKKEKKK